MTRTGIYDVVPGDVAGCSHCGSPRVYPKIWVGGFLPTVNDERQVYVCRDCGGEGMLLLFGSEQERLRFSQEDGRRDTRDPEPSPDAIPILPIDAVPLAEVRGIDVVPIYRPKIVDVRWTDGKLRRGGYRVDVDAYWDAVGGPRYNADHIFVLDLAGVNHASPNFDAVRFVSKRSSVLLDLGAREAEDVMDGFMVDVESVVVGTKTLSTAKQFEEIHALSEGVLPCIDFADGVVWNETSREDRNLRVAATALREIGYSSVAIMDLRRLGTFAGPDPRLVAQVEDLDFEVFLGGGIREEDVPSLRERGVRHGLVDPFTPVIRALLPTRREEVPADAIPSTRPARDPRGTPTPS